MNIKANGISISTVTAKLADGSDNLVVTATNTITFSITGNGTWSDGSVSPQSIPCFNGIATIAVKSTTITGSITITSNSVGLTDANTNITAVHGPICKTRIKFH